jgi:hypothetical protein
VNRDIFFSAPVAPISDWLSGPIKVTRLVHKLQPSRARCCRPRDAPALTRALAGGWVGPWWVG